MYVSAFQLEIGSTATAFSRAGGTIQGELAACQRYYQTYPNPPLKGLVTSTNQPSRMGTILPVVMRATPSNSLVGSISLYDGGNTATSSAITIGYQTASFIEFDLNVASGTLTAYRPCIAYNNSSVTGTLNLSAEL